MIDAETMKHRYLVGLVILANTLATVMTWLVVSDLTSAGPWAALASGCILISCVLLVFSALRHPKYS